MEPFNNYVQINLDAIRTNYRAVCKKAGVPVMAVVKADAYGHGAVAVARLLAPECPFFGVSSLSEAMELRQAGITVPILILGHAPASAFPQMIAHGIRPTLFTLPDARAFSREAQKQGVTAPVHLAVDTGMSRIGFPPTEESAATCAEISRLPGVQIEGLFSHFATADTADLTRSRAQADRFAHFCALLANRGVTVPIRHLDNSAGIMNFGAHYEMVRSGIVTYGMYPSAEVDPARLPLTPALSWYSRVAHVKWLEPGREIGYGGTYVTTVPTRVATVPVGYADGYRRSLSNRFYVLIHGCRAPILGRICMDQLMVDVTHIGDVAEGDTVTLIGTDGDEAITMEQIAEAADSFNYEFTCGISRRVCRQYLLDGKPAFEVDFLISHDAD